MNALETRMMIEENLKLTENKPLYGICWNHWRTYENRVASRYAAKAMIEGLIPAMDFYYSNAENLEIENSDISVKAFLTMTELQPLFEESSEPLVIN